MKNAVCFALILSFVHLPISNAKMISTDQYAQKTRQNLSPRDRILSLLQKTEVQQKMIEMGLSVEEAQQRIASLSDSEIAQLNEKIDQLPAGGDAAGSILGTALAVFIILLITDILCWTKVFKFTRCAR